MPESSFPVSRLLSLHGGNHQAVGTGFWKDCRLSARQHEDSRVAARMQLQFNTVEDVKGLPPTTKTIFFVGYL